jgi:hypothetical protein
LGLRVLKVLLGTSFEAWSRAAQEIEHTLDHLLDCTCIPEGLALFKALCRYYYAINPAATAGYVHACRDMWDSDELGKQDAE